MWRQGVSAKHALKPTLNLTLKRHTSSTSLLQFRVYSRPFAAPYPGLRTCAGTALVLDPHRPQRPPITPYRGLRTTVSALHTATVSPSRAPVPPCLRAKLFRSHRIAHDPARQLPPRHPIHKILQSCHPVKKNSRSHRIAHASARQLHPLRLCASALYSPPLTTHHSLLTTHYSPLTTHHSLSPVAGARRFAR